LPDVTNSYFDGQALASHEVTFGWVDACPFMPLPFEDHLTMLDMPEKQASCQEKQASEPLAMIHMHIKLLVHWYSNQVVKSVPCHRVCKSWPLSTY